MSLLSDLIYKLGLDSYLLIPLDLISQLERHQQLSLTDSERGGLLIGIYRPPHIEITQISEPQKEDGTSRFEFIRRSKKHIDLVLYAWKKSKKIETYMGEWHTHPEDHPVPSSTDLKEWHEKFPKDRAKIVIIIGRVSNWYGFWDGGNVTALNIG